ncbi:MAG: penicillin-binding protein 2 [Bacillota bacterium]
MRTLVSIESRRDQGMNVRLQRLGVAVGVVFAVLAARLWYLQIIRGSDYAAMADRNHLRVVPVTAPRGRILDREGREIARNRLSFTLSVLPEAVPNAPQQLFPELARLLRVPEAKLQEAWESAARRYSFEPVRLVRDMKLDQLIAIEEHRASLPGVFVEEEPVRDYPLGATAAHVLGHVGLIGMEDLKRLSDEGYRGSDIIGLAGIERYYERDLRGTGGYRQIEVDALGRYRRLVGEQPPVPGHDLKLTLDLELQQKTENALIDGIQKAEERRLDDPKLRSGKSVTAGAVVVLDPRTGAVLAMASFPAYDPGRLLPWEPDRAAYLSYLNRDEASPFLNRATMGTYAPGSAFKVVTGVAALEERKFGLNERWYADGLGPYGKKDWMVSQKLVPGWLTLVSGFEWSSNDFFWELGHRVGVDALAEWARRFGLGQPTGIDLPGDRPGLVPDRQWKKQRYRNQPAWAQQWYEAETLDMAIGQGFLEVTPLQMAVVYMAVANNGIAYRPHLVQSIKRPDGTFVRTVTPSVLLQVQASPSTWKAVREGLKAVVNGPHGTAKDKMKDVPVPVAGKTGTAQVGDGESQPHAWFAAIAPADDPQVVVVVVVEHGGSGSGAAAPIAEDVLKAYFQEYPPRSPASATATASRQESG